MCISLLGCLQLTISYEVPDVLAPFATVRALNNLSNS